MKQNNLISVQIKSDEDSCGLGAVIEDMSRKKSIEVFKQTVQALVSLVLSALAQNSAVAFSAMKSYAHNGEIE
jgi:hypothetical protein